jgi:ubiquinone/menaquinone biosynthesis C-methylase UbiE
MADAFDPQHAGRLEDPARLEALPQTNVVSFLRLRGDETVVDYGAGTGIYTVAVAAALPRGRVIAVEALPRLADMLRAKLGPGVADRLELVESDENTVPVPDGAADRVLMVDVLHHLYDQPAALAEVVRLLRPGGLYVVLDWGDHERPVGPPLEHVLGLAAVRDVIAAIGLEEIEAHEPGTTLPYHLALVATKPLELPPAGEWLGRTAQTLRRVTSPQSPHARV